MFWLVFIHFAHILVDVTVHYDGQKQQNMFHISSTVGHLKIWVSSWTKIPIEKLILSTKDQFDDLEDDDISLKESGVGDAPVLYAERYDSEQQ